MICHAEGLDVPLILINFSCKSISLDHNDCISLIRDSISLVHKTFFNSNLLYSVHYSVFQCPQGITTAGGSDNWATSWTGIRTPNLNVVTYMPSIPKT